ncbi:HDIG domain-containing protein [Candidatus Beckwithbacteria bacterium]|nr:HDIG domain-containing protein [Candidatus Beckwithbacteria bacterium]
MQINIPLPVEKVLEFLRANNFQSFIVGGSVRDILAKREIKDWDFTTNATPEKIQAIFPESFYDNQFGTVGITVEELIKQFDLQNYDPAKDNLELGSVFEITTFRSDGEYKDNRRPETVTWGDSIEDDLQRRDFTINALALKKENGSFEIIDLYNGQKDLENKIIRCVGNPDERFGEDGLRLLRAVRFAAQLGFIIDPQTLNSIAKNAHLIQNISWERIRDEILKMVVYEYSSDGFKLLLSTGLLHFILPELEKTVGVKQAGHHTKDVWHHSIDAMKACPTKDAIVKFACLLHDVGKPIAYREENDKITFYGHEVVSGKIAKKVGQRFHFSNKDQERLYLLVRYHMFSYQKNMTDAAIRRFIRKVGLENIQDMMTLRIGDRVGGGSKETSWRLTELQQRIKQVLYTPMQIKDLKVDGHDVMQILNINGGPKVGQVLKTLFDEVMEDSQKNDREYLLKKIEELK